MAPLPSLYGRQWEIESRWCYCLVSQSTVAQTTVEFLHMVAATRTFIWFIYFNIVFKNYTLVGNRVSNNKVMVLGLHCFSFTVFTPSRYTSFIHLVPVNNHNFVTLSLWNCNFPALTISVGPLLTCKNTQWRQNHTHVSGIHGSGSSMVLHLPLGLTFRAVLPYLVLWPGQCYSD
jgi:hypothetical protein